MVDYDPADAPEFEEVEIEEVGTVPAFRSDRKRGILTKRDREYLLDEIEIEGQEENNLRYRLRERIKQSILDLKLIRARLDQEELRKIAESLAETVTPDPDRNPAHPTGPSLDLGWLAYDWMEVDPFVEDQNEYMEQVIEWILWREIIDEMDEFVVENVETTVKVDKRMLDEEETIRKMKNGKATELEIRTLLHHGDIEYLEDIPKSFNMEHGIPYIVDGLGAAKLWPPEAIEQSLPEIIEARKAGDTERVRELVMSFGPPVVN